MKNKVYTITEYQGFVCKEAYQSETYKYLEPETFNALEEFVLFNNNNGTDAVELMSLSAKKGMGKVIAARNYVGMIAMNNGTIIEILPKISKADVSYKESKEIFLKMLASLKDFQYKTMQTSGVNIDKISIFEIFIKMFVDEIKQIVKRGIRSDYVSIEDNLDCFKGKLLLSKQVCTNYAHKEKAYVCFDEFSPNRPENKIVKATLEYLYRYTDNLDNKKNIRILIDAFDNVDASTNYAEDFAKCRTDRSMVDYQKAISWCKVFLQGKSFTSFTGSNIAFALLFPMDALFESYIAAEVKKIFRSSEYSVTAQDRRYHLYDTPAEFLLKPDIVIKSKVDNKTFIFDTKWKLLYSNQPHYGISQADMYQMYAYQHKYKSEDVTLLYPSISGLESFQYTSAQGDLVRIRFVDLQNARASLVSCLENVRMTI